MTKFIVGEATASAQYVAPRLTVVGTLEQITQKTGIGGYTDANFPAHTPRADLTFS